MKISPITAKRRWNEFKNDDLCHLSLVSEYMIDQYQHMFVAYSEVTSSYVFSIFDSIEKSLSGCQEFKSKKDADLFFAQRIISHHTCSTSKEHSQILKMISGCSYE